MTASPRTSSTRSCAASTREPARRARAPTRPTAAWSIRALRPAAEAVTGQAGRRQDASRSSADPPRRRVRGRGRGRRAAAALRARGRLRRRRQVHDRATPTRSCRRSASSTCTSIGEGRHEELYERLGAHVHRASTASRAPRSRSGRRRRGRSASSATSTPGTGACTRCARWARRASGSCSCPASAPARATSTRSCAPTASCCSRPTRYAQETEMPPQTASVVARLPAHAWSDDGAGWPAREHGQPLAGPMSIYEVHLGSWRLNPLEDNRAADLRRAGRRARGLRHRHGLHPRRAAAGDGAPVQRLVGLPGDRLLRAHAALRLARRLPRVRRPHARRTASA